MKTYVLAALAALILASPALAQDTVFPEKTGSLINFRAQAYAPTLDVNGIPETAEAKSISLHFDTDPNTQIPGSCVLPDANLIGHFVDLPITDDGTRRIMRGRTHETNTCSGLQSGPSANVAVVYFNEMGEPELLPMASYLPLLAEEFAARGIEPNREIVTGRLDLDSGTGTL